MLVAQSCALPGPHDAAQAAPVTACDELKAAQHTDPLAQLRALAHVMVAYAAPGTHPGNAGKHDVGNGRTQGEHKQHTVEVRSHAAASESGGQATVP
jgi:hypothetical protein